MTPSVTDIAAAEGLDYHFERAAAATPSTPTGWSTSPQPTSWPTECKERFLRGHFVEGDVARRRRRPSSGGRRGRRGPDDEARESLLDRDAYAEDVRGRSHRRRVSA